MSQLSAQGAFAWLAALLAALRWRTVAAASSEDARAVASPMGSRTGIPRARKANAEEEELRGSEPPRGRTLVDDVFGQRPLRDSVPKPSVQDAFTRKAVPHERHDAQVNDSDVDQRPSSL